MEFAISESSARDPHDALKKTREHTLLIIDSIEERAQKLAQLLTLAGLRVLVTTNTYQAFNRFLQERFVLRAIIIGQQEEANTPLFFRFFQRLTQEYRYETPVIVIPQLNPNNHLLLTAEDTISTTKHVISQKINAVLWRIWQLLPSAQVAFKRAEKTMVLDSLPKLGFQPRVTHNKRSFSSHLYYQLKAAKKVIAPEQWEMLLTDVGLAQFCKEENWPANVDTFTIPPEYFSLLTRAVMFSDIHQPIKKLHDWADQVEADTLQKAFLIFIMQQIPKIIGADRTMRTLLNTMTNEIDSRRGEKLTEWKRLDDGSFIFVFYSNVFVYGLIGAEQPLCTMWQSTFDLVLELSKQQQRWHIREVECSGQTHTGHCVFLISPR